MADYNLYQGGQITTRMLWSYFGVTLVFFVLMNLAFVFLSRGARNKKTKAITYSLDSDSLYGVGLFFYLVGASARIYEIIRAGGIVYVLQNLWNRVSLLSGLGYIEYLTVFKTIGLCCIEASCNNRPKQRKHKFVFILLLVLGIALNLAFGARSGFMKMLFALLFVYYYLSPDKHPLRRFFKVRYLIAGVAILAILVVLPTFRKADFDYSQVGFDTFVSGLFDGGGTIVNEVSLYDEDVFVIDYFSSHDFWYGENYINLLTAWLPRSLFPNKGIIDDGMYLRALMKGLGGIYPTMSLSDLHELGVSSSIPFTTSGIFYANFGILGTIVGGWVTGTILYRSYLEISRTKSVLDILFYQFLCTRLCLSVKGIVELIMMYLLCKIAQLFLRMGRANGMAKTSSPVRFVSHSERLRNRSIF